MTTRTFVDVEGPLRTWLRGNSTVTAVAGQRVYIGTPKLLPTLPWASLFLVADTPQPDWLMARSNALVQIDCYASTKQAAAGLAYAIVSALESIVPGTLLDSTVRCYAASVTRNQWLPDTSAPIQPRYSVDVLLAIVAAGQ